MLTYAGICWRMLTYADVCSLSVCGVKAAIHIDERGVIWLNLSQLMKLVGKTKKQVSVFALLYQ